MLVLRKVIIMKAIILFSHIKWYSASLHSNIYCAKNNIRITRPYHELTDVQRLKCLSECDKDFMCLSVNYHHGNKKCELTSFRHDDVLIWSTAENGRKLYYQKTNDARFISGIQAWESSVLDWYLKPGSLTIDRRFLSHFVNNNSCFHSNFAESNYLIVELDRTTSVTNIDLLFRSDCCSERNQRFNIIVSPTKADADANKGAVCAFYNGPPHDPRIPERIKCAANSTGKFVKFIQNNFTPTPMNICEIAFYTNE